MPKLLQLRGGKSAGGAKPCMLPTGKESAGEAKVIMGKLGSTRGRRLSIEGASSDDDNDDDSTIPPPPHFTEKIDWHENEPISGRSSAAGSPRGCDGDAVAGDHLSFYFDAIQIPSTPSLAPTEIRWDPSGEKDKDGWNIVDDKLDVVVTVKEEKEEEFLTPQQERGPEREIPKTEVQVDIVPKTEEVQVDVPIIVRRSSLRRRSSGAANVCKRAGYGQTAVTGESSSMNSEISTTSTVTPAYTRGGESPPPPVFVDNEVEKGIDMDKRWASPVSDCNSNSSAVTELVQASPFAPISTERKHIVDISSPDTNTHDNSINENSNLGGSLIVRRRSSVGRRNSANICKKIGYGQTVAADESTNNLDSALTETSSLTPVRGTSPVFDESIKERDVVLDCWDSSIGAGREDRGQPTSPFAPGTHRKHSDDSVCSENDCHTHTEEIPIVVIFTRKSSLQGSVMRVGGLEKIFSDSDLNTTAGSSVYTTANVEADPYSVDSNTDAHIDTNSENVNAHTDTYAHSHTDKNNDVKQDIGIVYVSYSLLAGPKPIDMPGVNPSALEDHLCDEEFKKILRMSREDFKQLPRWKQTSIKKAVSLF